MEDKNFEKLINDLKNLRKVEAPNNFEFKLQLKLENSISKESLPINKVKKLVPAFAFVSIILFLFVIFRPFADEYEDPLQIQPQIREDIIAYSETKGQYPLTQLLNDSFKEDSDTQKNLIEQSNRTQEKVDILNKNLSSSQHNRLNISKKELNFTRPVTSDEEIKQIQALKQKLIIRSN